MLRVKRLISKQIAVLVLALAGPFFAVAHADPRPWSLRDHYAFSGTHATFKFEIKTAEWMIEVEDRGPVFDDVASEIEFADGKVLRLSRLSAVKDGREKFSGPLGEGTYFRSVFRTNDSLQITYSVARFKERPFLLIYVSIENRSPKPVEITSIRPVVFDRGAISELDAATVVTQARTTRRGIFPVLHSSEQASLVRFAFGADDVTLGVGVLQSGMMNAYVDLKSEGPSWYGAVRCDYEPMLRIEPGMTVGSDPVWLSFSVPDSGRVKEYHAWAESAALPRLNIDAVPGGWVTIGPEEPVTALYEAARAWNGTQVHHALVPASWEAKPGAQHGSTPRYPKDMKKVAHELHALGMVPGISVDPLAVGGGEKEWSLRIDSGARWLDVTRADASAYAAEQMARFVSMGYRFFVVERSAIPDEVLRHYNVTRSQADSLALEIVARAAAGLPVFPSAGVTLDGDLAAWRSAASSTAFYEDYGMVAGPVRFSVGDLAKVSPGLAEAVGHYAGPIEFMGSPKRKVRRKLATLRRGPADAELVVSSTAGGK